jgi:hypothetical protein
VSYSVGFALYISRQIWQWGFRDLINRLSTEQQSLLLSYYVSSLRTMLQTGRSPVQVPDKVHFFNSSNRTMALGSSQPLTEMSTRNLPGG